MQFTIEPRWAAGKLCGKQLEANWKTGSAASAGLCPATQWMEVKHF